MMVRTQVQLTERQAEALKRLAAIQGVSMAELIRRSLDTFLKSARTMDREEMRRRALGAVGKFRSGRSDVSSLHDRHLAESYAE